MSPPTKKPDGKSVEKLSAQPEVRLVPVAALRTNPVNPRKITKQMFERLKKSLEQDPDLLWSRPILATADGVVYAGNMRLRAAIALGRDVVPAVVEDIDSKRARDRMLTDNNSYGEYEEELLSELAYNLREEGVDLGVLGFEDKEIARILALSGADGETPEEKKIVCPQCGAEFAAP